MIPALQRLPSLVVKVGSSLLVDPESGVLHETWLDGLAADVAKRPRESADARGRAGGRADAR